MTKNEERATTGQKTLALHFPETEKLRAGIISQAGPTFRKRVCEEKPGRFRSSLYRRQKNHQKLVVAHKAIIGHILNTGISGKA
jgi:hypothetical protein